MQLHFNNQIQVGVFTIKCPGESHVAGVDVMGSLCPLRALLPAGKTSHVFPFVPSLSFGVCAFLFLRFLFRPSPALPASISPPLWDRKCVALLVCWDLQECVGEVHDGFHRIEEFLRNSAGSKPNDTNETKYVFEQNKFCIWWQTLISRVVAVVDRNTGGDKSNAVHSLICLITKHKKNH